MSTDNNDIPRLLSVSEVARQLGCTAPMVRTLIDDGDLEAYRWPNNQRRIPVDAIEKFKAKWLTTPISVKAWGQRARAANARAAKAALRIERMTTSGKSDEVVAG